MPRLPVGLLLCLLLILAVPLRAADETAEVARLVKQLGDDDFAKREAASKRLAEIGEPALDALQAARKSNDAEVRRRAEEAFDNIMKQLCGEVVRFSGHQGAVWNALLTPDGKHIVSCGEDKTLRLWDLGTGKQERLFTGHTGKVLGIALSPDGKRLASCGSDKQLRIWDVETGKELRRFADTKETIGCVVWLGKDRLLTGDFAGVLKQWDADTGQELRLHKGERGSIMSIALSPDGKKFVVASCRGGLEVGTVESDQLERGFRGHEADVMDACFSPNGKQLLSAGLDKTLRFWDVESGKELRCQTLAERQFAVAFSPDGKRALSGGADNGVHLWDLEAGKELHSYLGHTDGVMSVRFFADGRRALSCGLEGTIRVWVVPKGTFPGGS